VLPGGRGENHGQQRRPAAVPRRSNSGPKFSFSVTHDPKRPYTTSPENSMWDSTKTRPPAWRVRITWIPGTPGHTCQPSDRAVGAHDPSWKRPLFIESKNSPCIYADRWARSATRRSCASAPGRDRSSIMDQFITRIILRASRFGRTAEPVRPQISPSNSSSGI
jgi:hypothetical protein